MKYIITERQSRLLEEPEKILKIPSLSYFNNDWELLQKFLENRGYPPYSISGNLNLSNTSIESLGNLRRVEGFLNLNNSSIQSLGNLEYVGGDLYLKYTPLSETTSEDEIRSKINVEGNIHLQ